MQRTILIVDDSATTRALIKRAIGISGFGEARVIEAGNGREGLASASENHPDVILADLQMPEMNGVEMIQRLFEAPGTRDIPVVVVSAEPNQATIDALRRAGVKGHLAKPFTPERIRDVVGPLLENVRA